MAKISKGLYFFIGVIPSMPTEILTQLQEFERALDTITARVAQRTRIARALLEFIKKERGSSPSAANVS